MQDLGLRGILRAVQGMLRSAEDWQSIRITSYIQKGEDDMRSMLKFMLLAKSNYCQS